MKLYFISSILVILFFACSSSKKTEILVCDTTTFSKDNSKNDTSIISFLQAGVFDTNVSIIYGSLIDIRTLLPLRDFKVQISRGLEKLIAETNDDGEFKFSRVDLNEGEWELFINPKKYACLYVKAINQFETQSGFVKCKIKMYIPQ